MFILYRKQIIQPYKQIFSSYAQSVKAHAIHINTPCGIGKFDAAPLKQCKQQHLAAHHLIQCDTHGIIPLVAVVLHFLYPADII